MRSELRGCVPKLPISYTGTLINRAWREIRERGLWSFQLYEFSWITPPPVQAGTVAVIQGSPTITFDLTVATPAILASQVANPYSPITARQFRIAVGGIYNIIAFNFGTGVATLDRPFGDPSGSSDAYQIYQNYYVAPVKDHKALFSVRNPQMYLDLELDATREWIDARDPQRTWYQFPTHVVPWGADNRGAGLDPYATPGTGNISATYGFPMFELWGVPVSPFVYQAYAIRSMPDLVAPSDTLPYTIGEDVVLARARIYAYEWAEANKIMAPRAVGPDFKFLTGVADAEYKKLLAMYRMRDREFIDNWFSVRESGLASRAYGYYNTIAGFAGPYSQI